MSGNSGRFDDFKYATRVRALNLWAQIALGAMLFAGLNFLAARHYVNFDLSRDGAHSLSPESAAYVKGLKEPVEIYCGFRSRFGKSRRPRARGATCARCFRSTNTSRKSPRP